MGEVSVRINSGADATLYESYDLARNMVAAEAWRKDNVTLVEFLDANDSVIETWTKTIAT